MTYQIALCDDETAELRKTEKLLSDYEHVHSGLYLMIKCFRNADELLQMVKEKKYEPDLVFMDICMPGQEAVPIGIDAAKQLREMGCMARLLFLTNTKEYALDAFDVDAFFYLLKPVSKDKLFPVLDRFARAAEKERKKHILLRAKGAIVRVPLEDIVYCEAQRKCQCIYLSDGAELIQNMTMAKLYELCSAGPEFVKVGASYIVNLEHIESLSAKEAQMDNGQKIYLPRGTYHCVREQYLDYYCGKE